MPSLAPRLLAAALVVGAARAASREVKSTVFTHGENGWPCYRIPGTLALPFDVMLSFAAARSYTGDVRCHFFPPATTACAARRPDSPWALLFPQHCYPLNASYPKQYSARVVKRSTDRGATCEPPHHTRTPRVPRPMAAQCHEPPTQGRPQHWSPLTPQNGAPAAWQGVR